MKNTKVKSYQVVAYQGKKKAKTSNMLILTDSREYHWLVATPSKATIMMHLNLSRL